MFQIELPQNEYERLRLCLAEIHPEIQLNLDVCDRALFELGLSDYPLCVVQLNLTNEEMDNLMEEIMDFEVFAVGASKKSEEYKKYARYTWMWAVLDSAIEK